MIWDWLLQVWLVLLAPLFYWVSGYQKRCLEMQKLRLEIELLERQLDAYIMEDNDDTTNELREVTGTSYPSIRSAAKAFGVPYTTMRHRLQNPAYDFSI